jgi:nucleoside-diphosphate-sugar epimerase
VLLRVGVDFVLTCTATLMAAIFYEWQQGAAAASLSYFAEAVASEFLGGIWLVAPIAMVLFCASKLYKPRPGGKWSFRLLEIAVACGVGVLMHSGGLFFLRGEVGRRSVVAAWAFLFVLVALVRWARVFLAGWFRIESRRPWRQHRVEDVLVVGGAGYIGSVLVRQLLARGYRVRVLDLFLFGDESLQDLARHPRLEQIEGDFRNVEHVVQALRGMDAVVHLAAIVGDPACAVDEQTTIAVNYEAAKMMARVSRAQGISRFVFASTCSVYGASDDIIDEQSELHPVSLYATTKIDAERALLEAVDSVFQPTILRLATAYGWSRRPRFDLVANLLSAKAVTDREITVFNGEQWRPFVNTRDIGRAMIAVLEAPLSKVGGEIFNVGDNTQNYTISELGQIVADAVPGTKVNEVRNEEDPRNYRVKFDKIEQTLNFRAAVSLEEGIQEIVDAVSGDAGIDWRDPQYSNLKQMQDTVLKVLKFEVDDREPHLELQATRAFLRRAA